MSQDRAWRPTAAHEGKDGWEVHIYGVGDLSVCALARFEDSVDLPADFDEPVAACGPCLLAASMLANLATQLALGAGDPRLDPRKSAEKLLEGPFEKVTYPEALREWVRGRRTVDASIRDLGHWNKFIYGGM